MYGMMGTLREGDEGIDTMVMEFLDKLNKCFDLIENLEIPTICLVHGAVLGGGAELALCCDFIVIVSLWLLYNGSETLNLCSRLRGAQAVNRF